MIPKKKITIRMIVRYIPCILGNGGTQTAKMEYMGCKSTRLHYG